MAACVASQEPTRTRRSAVPAGDPILASKITAPRVPGWAVPRPRITQLIARGRRRCPLTVITGPPGAGKTMALAMWAAAEPEPLTAWVGLDDCDNRPGVFWSYVMAALRRRGVAIPHAMQAAARGRTGDPGFLPRLAAGLAAQDPPVTLVVDDVHLLTDDKVLEELDFVLRNAGCGLRLAVCSRMDPPLPLYRYRLAGQMTQIRADDLAFTVAEAGLLLAGHGITLSPDSLTCLIQRTEGWAAGLRLAALSLGTRPDPDQFVKELIAEDSALTGYLVEEVLSAQPPPVRDVLLSTSILERFSADAAMVLTGDKKAARILTAATRANAFIQPAGPGWYRYHNLFAEVLQLELRREYPERVADLHHRAARWYARNGLLTDAVRHAAKAGDWQLAASLVIDELAISQILYPRGGHTLADHFASMPSEPAWSGPEPYLVWAAMALSAGDHDRSAAALCAADGILERRAGQQATARLTAAMIRLMACLRAGDPAAAAEAVAQAEILVDVVPDDKLARHPEIRAQVLAGRGAAELWSGHLDEAAQALQAAAAAVSASAQEHQPGCLGHLALAEALRGRLGHAAELAGRLTADLAGPGYRTPARDPDPAALVALAWVYLERHELRQARSSLKRASAALGDILDGLIGPVACLAAAGGALAEGRAAAAAQIIARARSGWPVPEWLEHRLALAESQAYAAAGDIQAALAAAGRAGRDTSPETAVTLAHGWAAAGDDLSARRALAPALAALSRVPDRVRMQAWLVDARLSYASGDRARGRRSLAAALRLAEPERVRLPFVLERGWLGPVLRRDPDLASAHRRLLGPVLSREPSPAPVSAQERAEVRVVEPLTDREREVLRHVSGLLNNAEVASEMDISVCTVKTHLIHIYRKLAVAGRGEAVRRARELELI